MRATSWYEGKQEVNGCDGQFGTFGVYEGTGTDFEFEFQDSVTHTPVVIPYYYFTFFDFDHGGGKVRGRFRLSLMVGAQAWPQPLHPDQATIPPNPLPHAKPILTPKPIPTPKQEILTAYGFREFTMESQPLVDITDAEYVNNSLTKITATWQSVIRG